MRSKSRITEQKIPSDVSCSIPLPGDFRVADVLDFHGRDTLAVAERIDGHSLQKGLICEGQPACLTIRFHTGRADVQLAVDGTTHITPNDVARMARRILGPTQRVEDFAHAYRSHPQLGLLIARLPGLRVPLSATPFEALTWAITGQQISLGAAISLRRRLIEAAGVRHSAGLACYPDAERMMALGATQLHRAGFSRAKAQALSMLSHEVAANLLPLETWTATMPVDEMREQLLRLRGIGPWTVDYTLLRGFGWLDGSLHGDAAVRRKLQRLLGSTAALTEGFTRNWLARFSPWRALVAAHLWSVPDEFLPAASQERLEQQGAIHAQRGLYK